MQAEPDSNRHGRDQVPILLLSAATLNTGHGWQSAMQWMGKLLGDYFFREEKRGAGDQGLRLLR